MARSSTTLPPRQVKGLSNEQKIWLLLQQEYDNDTILYNLTKMRENLQAIERDDERYKLAKKFGILTPTFDPVFRQRLMEQIRKCKCRYIAEHNEVSELDFLRDDDGSARHISEIPLTKIPRFSLGIAGVDEVLGEDEEGNKGIPRGCCLVMGAPKGVGKTRLTVQIAAYVGHPLATSGKAYDEEFELGGVLYIQNEEKVEIFRTRAAKVWSNHHRIMISSSDNLDQHVALIKTHRPKLVIVDSIQDTRQARFSAGIRHILMTYKAIAESMGISFWLISHVNTKGKLKGGTYTGHKVDIEMLAIRSKEDPSEFLISCDEKNRYGSTGRRALFRHEKEGIVYLPTVGDLARFGYKT